MIKNILALLFLTCLISNCKKHNNKSEDYVVTSITQNVYSIISPNFGLPSPENKGWNSNSHFIITKKGVLLFDSGSSETIGNKIKKAIKTVTKLPVLWVVNSHSHADHWLGNSAFENAEIITSKEALVSMKKYGEEDVKFYNKVSKGTIGQTKLTYPTKVLNKEEKHIFGETEVEFLFPNNAHSNGDILMWLPKQKVIFGGDVLSSDWMPILINPSHVQQLINTLKTIAKLQPEFVLTGHGKPTIKQAIHRDIDLLTKVMKLVKDAHQLNKKQPEIESIVINELSNEFQSKYKNFNTEIKQYVTQLYKLHQNKN